MAELISRIDHLEARVAGLEYRTRKRVDITTSLTDEERFAFEEQMRTLREDFLQERADRERMASKAESLQRQLTLVKGEYNSLQCRLASMQNIRRATYNRRFGVDPPAYQCDGAEEDEGCVLEKEEPLKERA